ncbi:MAG: MFS transporter, partial [archaeon]
MVKIKMKFSTKTKAIWNGIQFSHGMRRALTLALALLYFVHLGFDVVLISTLFAVAGIFAMFLEFPTGAVADYDSRKKSLMISFFLFSVAFLGIYFSSGFWIVAGFWILSEVAWTFNTGAGSAWVIDALEIGKKKSKVVKLISKGYLFEKSGRIIGGFIGLAIITINFRLIWLVAGLMNLLMFFIV